MSFDPELESKTKRYKIPSKLALVVFTGGLLLFWLMNTPPGLLGKSDAIAYAVCHRINSHSFHLGNRPFSLCARCSGQYLGFLWGFMIQWILGYKKSGFPSRWTVVGLVLLILVYTLDGLNSLFTFSPSLSDWSLYTPSNTLRLFTGLGMGLAISGFYYPLMGQTIWKDYSSERPLRRISDWLLWIGGSIGIGLLVQSGLPMILYTLILLSTGGLLALLTLLYTVIWILILGRENSFRSWQELGWWILAGFGTALLQIAVTDAARYLLTGSWSGFLGQ
jgi:uncharacterized membrane protein